MVSAKTMRACGMCWWASDADVPPHANRYLELGHNPISELPEGIFNSTPYLR